MMNESRAKHLFHKPTYITFDKTEIDLDFSVLEHSNTVHIPVCYTQLGIDKMNTNKFKKHPKNVTYVTEDMVFMPHSFIFLKSEFKTYEIDIKLLYSLYLKHKIEFDLISLIFHEKANHFWGIDNTYVAAYIDTLVVDYIKPTD